MNSLADDSTLLWQNDQFRLAAATHSIHGSRVEGAGAVFVTTGVLGSDGDRLAAAAHDGIIGIERRVGMEGNRESGVLAGSHPDDLCTGLDAEELVALGVCNTGLGGCASSRLSDIDFAGLGG